jgi:DASH complex subunit ASK1
MANTSFDSDIQDVPEQVVYSNDETFDASNDSFDSIAGPSGYAPPQDLLGDDSYMSDLAWPLPAGQTGRIAYDAGDMTFSTDGGTPNRSEAGLLFGGPADAAARGFALMKPDDMVTFHGGRLEDAEAQPSPTNLMRGK